MRVARRGWQVTAKAAASLKPLFAMADKLEPRMKIAFLTAVQKAQGTVEMQSLIRAIEKNDLTAATQIASATNWEQILVPMSKIPSVAYEAGGSLAAINLSPVAGVNIGWDAKHPRAARWATTNGSKLIKEVGYTNRDAIAGLVSDSFMVGRSAKQTAVIIRNQIGLTKAQNGWVKNYLHRLVEEGRPVEQIDRMITKYAKQTLNYRAELIARTEIMSAANAGQHELWQQAMDKGLLVHDQTWRKWQTAADARRCAICGGLSGKKAAFDKPFHSPGGGEYMYPPAHAMCRCSLTLSFDPPTKDEMTQPTVVESTAHEHVKPEAPIYGLDTHEMGMANPSVTQPQWRDLRSESRMNDSRLQADALDSYVGEHYDSINSLLRNGADAQRTIYAIQEAHTSVPAVEYMIKNIDAALERGTLEETTVLYRGFRNSGADQIASLSVGDSFVDPGFVSVTKSREFAEQWVSRYKRKAVVQIIVDGGQSVADLHATGLSRSEYEVLMQRNLRFTVIHKTDKAIVLKASRIPVPLGHKSLSRKADEPDDRSDRFSWDFELQIVRGQ